MAVSQEEFPSLPRKRQSFRAEGGEDVNLKCASFSVYLLMECLFAVVGRSSTYSSGQPRGLVSLRYRDTLRQAASQ